MFFVYLQKMFTFNIEADFHGNAGPRLSLLAVKVLSVFHPGPHSAPLYPKID